MKKDKKPISDDVALRQKEEKLLGNKPFKPGTQMNEIETLRLIHELQVHQIELEMQSEELRNAREELEITSLKYTEIFDYAPFGYFILTKEGVINEMNLSGAELLGKNSSVLINSNFNVFVSNDTQSVFNLFLQNIFSNKTKQTCELTLSLPNNLPVHVSLSGMLVNNREQCFIATVDISKIKPAEEALKQNEESIRIKLQTILSPEGSIADLELDDIIDAPSIQKLMDNFYELTQIPMSIIDKNDKILVGVGWQDICTKFHRIHPEACRNCFESDIHLTQGIPDGEFMLYKCKNNMWDMATPIIIGGEHKGNLFMGQFFFDDQPVDLEIFRKQAQEYSFDEREYLDALARVPRLNKNKLEHAKAFFLNFARSISQLSYSNIKLARAIEQQKNVEIALKESETRFKNLIANLPVGVLLHSANAEILFSNSKALELLGLKENQLIGRQPFDSNWKVINEDGLLMDPSEHPVVMAITTGKSVIDKVLGVFQPVKMKMTWLLVQAVPQLNYDGTVHQVISTFIDITKIKEDENKLFESEQRLRFHFENSPLGIVEWDSNFVVTQWSNEAQNLFGWRKEETIGKQLNSLNITLEEDIPIVSQTIEILKSGKQKMVISTNRNYTKEGKVKECTWYNSVLTNKSGELTSILSLVQDITLRKKAENVLKKLNEELEVKVAERTEELLKSNDEIKLAEEKYRTIANYNVDWESWLGPDGRFIYISPSCSRISGYSVDDFMNDPTLNYRIAHPDDREMVEKHHNESHKVGIPGNPMDFRIITRNGEEKWISHSCQPVYNDEGKWLGQRGSNSDITQRKKAESFLVNSQEKLRALTQRINELTENERKRISREIHDELGHMLTVLKYDIDSMMNNTELTVEQVNIELPGMFSMVESLIESVRKIATELRPGILDHLGLFPAIEWQINQFRMLTKVNCIYDIPDDLDVTFNKNETITIFRIIQEILTNVTRHSKAKKVEISSRIDNNQFVLNVKDNGVGFVPMGKIQSGSLGLMGMQERALSIGGEIEIDSAPGKGTSITLLLDKK